MTSIHLIGFDADDTLWHTETFYIAAKERLAEILAAYAAPGEIDTRLEETEHRNVPLYGYGIKSFLLSMIETAVELSGGAVTGEQVGQILAVGREMLAFNMQVFDGVDAALARLAPSYPLVLITKGDLLDQEAKLAHSGLSSYFEHIEIVSEKDPAAYMRILERLHIAPESFLMVGNSLKSDILPVVQIGGQAVYIPYANTWVREQLPEGALDPAHYHQIDTLAGLPELVERLTTDS